MFPLISEDLSARSFLDSRSEGKPCAHLPPITPCSYLHRYKLAAMKLVTPSKEHLEKHYEDLSDKPFYKGLVTCMLQIHPLEATLFYIRYVI